MSVDLWAARLERPLTKGEAEKLLLLLPAGRRERLMKLRREEWRREPLCAYAMLRIALRQRYGWETLPEMAMAEQGKPRFPKYPEVHFSISHTDGAVLAGLADVPIGVDLERIRPVSERTMGRVAGTASETFFFRTWVRREARTKLRGSGISAMLRSEPPMMPEEHYREVELFPGYLAGTAVCGGPPEIQVRICALEEILAWGGA